MPYWNISGVYLLRGWCLYYLRRIRYRLTGAVLTGGFIAIIPLLGYQTGGLSVAPVKTPATHGSPVTLEALATPTAPIPAVSPPAPAPVAPASIKLLPYRTSRGNGYAWGNCTYYAAARRSIPPGWGHARSWLYSARRAGHATGAEPRVGAIAWTSAGRYGHVAIVEAVSNGQVQVAEMNFMGYNRISTRWIPASSFQYIY